jgi:hypothetical protein
MNWFRQNYNNRSWIVVSVILALAILLLFVFAAIGRDASVQRPQIGLMTTLPLQWQEGEIDQIIRNEGQPALAYQRLSEHFAMRAIDDFSASSLQNVDVLLLAQPRAFSPGEFADLDEWIRGGGRLLLLADPALRWESIYPLGDKRRPLFTSLMSPLFRHWGLELMLAMDVGDAPYQTYSFGDETIRTATAGEWQKLSGAGGECNVAATPILAECQIGKGRAILLADADLLDAVYWQASGVRVLSGSDDFDNIAWTANRLHELASTKTIQR